MPAAPRRYLAVVPGPLPVAELVVCRRYLAVAPRPMPTAPLSYSAVVPRPLPAAPLVVCRRYLIVVPRPLPAAALVVRRRYLAMVPRPWSAALLALSVEWQGYPRGNVPSASSSPWPLLLGCAGESTLKPLLRRLRLRHNTSALPPAERGRRLAGEGQLGRSSFGDLELSPVVSRRR